MCCGYFEDTATTEISTLSLHDALPIDLAVEQPVSPMVKKAKGKNDISLDKNISDSFTKRPGHRLGEHFVVQS